MKNIKIYVLNLLYLFRMFKDKTKQSFLNWYIGKHKKVNRIYDNKETVMNHIYKLTYNMTPIIDNIYLGNACDASYYYRLQNNNIKYIINVTNEIPNYFKNDFEYFNIKINDLNQESFNEESFQNVLQFIYNVQKKNKEQNLTENILVHCYMGSSRSATIVLLYLLDKYKYTIEQSLDLLKNKRDIVNINTNFLNNLKIYVETQKQEINNIKQEE